MAGSQSEILYLFIDESGNFDFSLKGTKFFVLTGFLTSDPMTDRAKLLQLRYRLLAEGEDQEYFHASEDKQIVRDQVYKVLSEIGNTFEVRSIIARKSKTNPGLYKEIYEKKGKTIERNTGMGLYKKLAECLLQYIFKGKEGKVEKIVVVLGSLYVGEKRKIILQTLKSFLKNKFSGIPFEIFSHQTCADLNCQLADYCCWAIAVKVERGEGRPYEVIKDQVKSVFDIFRNGDIEYY
jgi:hypothetical protein